MKTRFIAVLLASIFLWTPIQPLPQERVATAQEVCPSNLGAYENIFTFDESVDSRWRRNIVRRALTVCEYDFQLLRTEYSAYGVGSTIHINFDLGSGRFLGTYADGEAEGIAGTISLSRRFGVDGGYRGASSVLIHELGHAVDALVLTNDNANRRAITAALCPTEVHQWSGGRYRNQTGEAFADAFAAMYGGGLRPWTNWGHHKLTPKAKRVIRRVLES